MRTQMVDPRELTKEVLAPSIPVPFALHIPHPSLYKHEVMKQLGCKPTKGVRLETLEPVCRVVWASVEDVCWLCTRARRESVS